MPHRLAALPAFGALVAVAVAAPGAVAGPHAVAPPCPHFTGVVSSGTVSELTVDPATGMTNGLTTHTGPLVRSTPYVASSTVAFTVGANRYRAARGTEFSIGCYGQNVHRPKVLYPSVLLHVGTLTLRTAASKPGAVITLEALVNPVGHTAQRIVVTRRQRGGAGTVRVSATGPKVDLTPEVGSHAGHCIYWNHARLVSRWNQRRQDFDLKVSATR